jgi:hypothetical protein
MGVHIECTNGSPIVDTLDHFPPLPLFLNYITRRERHSRSILTKQDELGIYHALRLHDRVRHLYLCLPPSVLHKVLVLMDQHFPMLEYLSLSFEAKNTITLTLPKAFLAPNLRHLALTSITPQRRLHVLTSTVSLVRLELGNIQTSSYFRPRVLVARLSSLPQLEILYIEFSVPIPRPSTERELIGEPGAPVTLPSLTNLRFKGVSAYLESLVAQIQAPRLVRLDITLFNQIAFALPYLSHLISTMEAFKLSDAAVNFGHKEFSVTMAPHDSAWFDVGPFFLRVMCEQLDWQIDCAAQICNALIPALSSVERFTLHCYFTDTPKEWKDGEIDSTMWHELLRSFAALKDLHIYHGLLAELSLALQLDEAWSDPEYLPNLRSITARDNQFSSFIDIRQVLGRPVQFFKW